MGGIGLLGCNGLTEDEGAAVFDLRVWDCCCIGFIFVLLVSF